LSTILVTGATGLVGFEVLDALRAAGHEAVGTSRRGDLEAGIVPWTLGEPVPSGLDRSWDVIVHSAADVRWTMTEAEAQAANVATVAALAPLAGPRTRVVHISTAYATGLRGDTDSADPADYRNTYEWSKAHAERLARELFPRLTIVRPPLIVGRRSDGRAARFAGMYTILRGIAMSSVPVIAAEPDAPADVIPVDDLAGLVAECALLPGTGEVHLLAGGKRAPSVEAVVGAMLAGLNGRRAEHGGEPLDAPRIITPDSWHRFFLPFARRHLTVRQNRLLDLLSHFEPYFALTTPLSPTHEVDDVLGCVEASARHWADRNPRLASLDPRPWKT